MDAPVFADKAHRPTEADLTAALGQSKKRWDALLARARDLVPQLSATWKHYAGKSGWTFVLRDKRRNLCYLKAGTGCFSANFALGDDALAAARKSSAMPQDLIESIAASPKYPEGRAARLQIRSPKDLKIAAEVLALKIAS